MKNTNKKSAKSTNKVLVSKVIKNEGKLNINTDGNLVIENVKKIEDELIVEKLIELKKAFGFLCLIKDVRAINLFDDCGYGGKTLYLNLKDLNYYDADSVNGHYYYKGNNYALVLKAGKVSWMDLWKTIEALVRLSGDREEFIVDTFEVRESSKHKLYVEDIVNFKVFCVYEEEDNDDDC